MFYNRINIFITFFICILSVKNYAQDKTIDSLLTLIKTENADTLKLLNLNKVCRAYIFINKYSEALDYANEAIELSDEILKAESKLELPLIRRVAQRGKALSNNMIGVINMNLGNYPDALVNYFNALKLFEQLNDKKGIAYASENIGIVYENQGNLKKALSNFELSLKIKREINDLQGIANSLENIGTLYEHLGKYAEAIKNHKAALEISKNLNDKNGMSNSYLNIGLIYFEEGNYEEALKNDFISLNIKQEIGHEEGVAHCYVDLGAIYTKLNKLNEGRDYFYKALKISHLIGAKELIKQSYLGLVIIDSISNDYKKAFEHYKKYISYRDTLNNEESEKKSLEASMQYEFDKKELAAKAKQDKLNTITEKEKQKQKIIIYSVSGILALALFFSWFIFNRFKIIRRQKVIIEDQKVLVDKAYESLHEKNKEVIDSIHYAKRIQRALITSENYIDKQLNRLNKKS